MILYQIVPALFDVAISLVLECFARHHPVDVALADKLVFISTFERHALFNFKRLDSGRKSSFDALTGILGVNSLDRNRKSVRWLIRVANGRRP